MSEQDAIVATALDYFEGWYDRAPPIEAPPHTARSTPSWSSADP